MNSSKLKVAIVTYVSIDNLYSGQKKRIYDLVEGLSEYFEIDYIEITDKKFKSPIDDLSNRGVNRITYPLGYSIFVKIITQIINGIIYPLFGIKKSIILGLWGAFYNRKKFNNTEYDIVISEYFMSSYFFKYLKNKPLKVIDLHDIQYITLKESLKSKKYILKTLQVYCAKKVELNTIDQADILLAVNQHEIEILNKYIKKPILFTPLTINTSQISQPKELEFNSTINLGYFAGLSTTRTYEEIKYILEEILPKLNKHFHNTIRLEIYGNSPSQALLHLTENYSNVSVKGVVENLHDAFKNIHFGIYNWLGSSYGFRTRIIDILGAGTPILLNKTCVEGMGLDNAGGLYYHTSYTDIINTIEKFLNKDQHYFNASTKAIETANKFESRVIYNALHKELIGLKK